MKKIISVALTFIIIASFCVIPSAAQETDVSRIISAFSNQKSYAGAYLADSKTSKTKMKQVLHIATTDVAAFERRKDWLAKEHGFNGIVFDEMIFDKAKYTLAYLHEVTDKIWKDEDYRVESSGTDQSRNMIIVGIVNPPDGTEEVLREKYNCTNIEVEPYWLEYVQPGDAWTKAAARTASRSRADNYTGWASNSAGQRAYFKDGVRLTGVHLIDGFNCVFDQNGMFLGRRRDGADFTADFGEGQTLKISDGVIAFNALFTGVENASHTISSGIYPKLFVYMDGRFKEIPYDFFMFAEPAYIPNDDGVIRYQKRMSDFSCEFTPGLYRASIEVNTPNGKRNVVGEFNLIP